MKGKKKNKSSNKIIIRKYTPYLRVIIGFAALTIVFILAFKSIKKSEVSLDVEAFDSDVLGISDFRGRENIVLIKSPNNVEFILKEPEEDEISEANVKYQEKLKRLEEERIRKEEEEDKLRIMKIDALQKYLNRQNSPMAPYAELILNSCEKYGNHYCKFYLSIAGVESGFGRICSSYSAWGMVSVKYPSWEVAIPRAADWIAKNYYLRGFNTFEKLSYDSSYGPVNQEEWVKHLYYFYNMLPL